MAPAASIEELLTQLDPNTLPPAPSVWPLAMGYWLILLFTLVAITAVYTLYRKTKPWQSIRKELARIALIDDVNKRNQQAHVLLRWIAHRRLDQGVNLSGQALATLIKKHSGSEPPHWLNSHYQKQPTAEVSNDELAFIAKALFHGDKSKQEGLE
jgi:hypothetical protein